MEYRVLGKSGLEVSKLGFGGIPIQKVSVETVKDIMEAMLHNGINYIDTARGYTISEELIGEAIEGKRNKFILATKSMSRTKDGIKADIETSLKNLRTDYIDLYQIHNPSKAEFEQVLAEGGALEGLMEAKAEGKIGHIGFTTHSLELFEEALELEWVETIMFPYNIVENQGDELIKKCKEKNIGFIVMKPLAGGAIEDGELALRFICANPDISVVIPGMASVEEVEQNLKASENKEPLTEEEHAKMEAVRKELGNNFCRRCNYCAPCTKGINISGVFLMQGYLDRYGLEDWARTRYDAFAAKASDCIGCGVCETRCPYNLPIRDMLKEAAQRFGA